LIYDDFGNRLDIYMSYADFPCHDCIIISLIFLFLHASSTLIFFSAPQIHIPLDSVTKQAKGIAYVSFAQPSNAISAYEALDRKSFQGRLLHILGAVHRKGNVQVEEGDGRKRTIKEEKLAKRKAMAGKEFNWSMLYMNVRPTIFIFISSVHLLRLFRVTLWHRLSQIA
jgi:RNA recognition motif-containing protein